MLNTDLSRLISEQVQLALTQHLQGAAPSSVAIPSLDKSAGNGMASQAPPVPVVSGRGCPATSLQEPAPGSSGISLQEAVNAVLTGQSGESENPHLPNVDDGMFDLPLGATLSSKFKAKIVQGEYIDIAAILYPTKDDIMINLKPDSSATVSLAQNRRKTPLSIDQWTSAMLTYAAVYLHPHPSQAPALMKYIDFIRVMASQSPNGGWRTYDESFRRARQFNPVAWDKPIINLYMGAMFGSHAQQNQPAATKPFRGPKGPFIPRGYCFKYNLGKCDDKRCKFKHLCNKCQSTHPSTSCSKNNSRSQHGTEVSHPRQK